MIKFDYVKILASYAKKGKKTISLSDIYERYDTARTTEFRAARYDKKNQRHILGYKIGLIQIEKAIIDLARERGDVPEDMSYDGAREAVLDIQYSFNDVYERAEEYEKAAEKDFESMETRRKLNPRQYNEYRYLSLGNIADMETVNDAYYKLLETLDKQADQMLADEEPDSEQIISLNSIFKNIVAAHERISNLAKKREIDEKLLASFNSDASLLYMPYNFADVTYIPHRAINAKKGRANNLTVFETNNSFGDSMEITRLAEVGFGRFRQKSGKVTYRDYSTLGEYRIVKRYADPTIEEKRKEKIPIMQGGKIIKRGLSKNIKRPEHYWDDDLGGEVFYVYADLRERILFDDSQDPDARRFVTDVLLSNANMDVAMEKNGGYIGDLSYDKRQKQYTATFDRDKLCLAKELEAIKYKHRLGDVPIQIDIEKGSVHIGGEVVSTARKRPTNHGGEER